MFAKGWSFYLGSLCILAAAAAVSPGMAQNPPPAPSPAAQQAPKGCATISANALIGNIVQATGESLQRKRWQPKGGVIQFTLKSSPIAADASFLVCFRWRTGPDSTDDFKEARPDRLDRNNDGTLWTVTTTIPSNLPVVPADKKVETSVLLVPLADVRILASKDDRTLADATTAIGITYPFAAISFALAAVVMVLVALNVIVNRRLQHPGIMQANWFLRIISTPSGYASLSQLQIVLWTLVVAASAIYVMSLSGDLIEITSGALVLLGISGAAALGAKAHSESQSSSAQVAATMAQKEADKASVVAAQTGSSDATAAETAVASRIKSDADKKAAAAATTAKAFTQPPENQIPRWSDLIVTESTVDGMTTRELDVTRFQMLLFTLITSVFVLLTVVTTYVIPEIPTGFVTLMGISNGVYLGAKLTQRS